MPKNNPFKTPANFRRCSSRNFPKQIIVNRMFMISAERCHMPTSPARKLGPNLVGQQVLTRSVFFFEFFLNHAVAFKDSHEYIPNVTIAMFPLWCAVQHCNETTISWVYAYGTASITAVVALEKAVWEFASFLLF